MKKVKSVHGKLKGQGPKFHLHNLQLLYKIFRENQEVRMETKKIIQVEEKVPIGLLIPLSLQHTFAMFGASVLVPIIFGINPGVVLLMNGIGTLLFILNYSYLFYISAERRTV